MKDIIKKIVESAYQSKEGHIASSLSVLDILYVFYKNLPNDKLILSKGHASLGLYAILNHFKKGYMITFDDPLKIKKIDGTNIINTNINSYSNINNITDNKKYDFLFINYSGFNKKMELIINKIKINGSVLIFYEIFNNRDFECFTTILCYMFNNVYIYINQIV